MKKRFLGILALGLVFLYLSGSNYAQGFKPGTEPDNFRGIKWGTNIHSLPEMKFVSEPQEGVKFYKRENDKLMVGDASLSSLYYIFYTDRFCGSTIDFQGWGNFDKIKQTAFSTYGEGEKPNESIEEFRWLGTNVLVQLKYSETTEEGIMFWSYLPISKEMTVTDRDEKERAKEGQEEFEILEVKYREVERSENYVTVSWFVKVQNNTDTNKKVFIKVQFLDGDGFELAFDIEMTSLRPRVATNITKTLMIKRDIYPQIKSIRASL